MNGQPTLRSYQRDVGTAAAEVAQAQAREQQARAEAERAAQAVAGAGAVQQLAMVARARGLPGSLPFEQIAAARAVEGAEERRGAAEREFESKVGAYEAAFQETQQKQRQLEGAQRVLGSVAPGFAQREAAAFSEQFNKEFSPRISELLVQGKSPAEIQKALAPGTSPEVAAAILSVAQSGQFALQQQTRTAQIYAGALEQRGPEHVQALIASQPIETRETLASLVQNIAFARGVEAQVAGFRADLPERAEAIKAAREYLAQPYDVGPLRRAAGLVAQGQFVTGLEQKLGGTVRDITQVPAKGTISGFVERPTGRVRFTGAATPEGGFSIVEAPDTRQIISGLTAAVPTSPRTEFGTAAIRFREAAKEFLTDYERTGDPRAAAEGIRYANLAFEQAAREKFGASVLQSTGAARVLSVPKFDPEGTPLGNIRVQTAAGEIQEFRATPTQKKGEFRLERAAPTPEPLPSYFGELPPEWQRFVLGGRVVEPEPGVPAIQVFLTGGRVVGPAEGARQAIGGAQEYLRAQFGTLEEAYTTARPGIRRLVSGAEGALEAVTGTAERGVFFAEAGERAARARAPVAPFEAALGEIPSRVAYRGAEGVLGGVAALGVTAREVIRGLRAEPGTVTGMVLRGELPEALPPEAVRVGVERAAIQVEAIGLGAAEIPGAISPSGLAYLALAPRIGERAAEAARLGIFVAAARTPLAPLFAGEFVTFGAQALRFASAGLQRVIERGPGEIVPGAIEFGGKAAEFAVARPEQAAILGAGVLPGLFRTSARAFFPTAPEAATRAEGLRAKAERLETRAKGIERQLEGRSAQVALLEAGVVPERPLGALRAAPEPLPRRAPGEGALQPLSLLEAPGRPPPTGLKATGLQLEIGALRSQAEKLRSRAEALERAGIERVVLTAEEKLTQKQAQAKSKAEELVDRARSIERSIQRGFEVRETGPITRGVLETFPVGEVQRARRVPTTFFTAQALQAEALALRGRAEKIYRKAGLEVPKDVIPEPARRVRPQPPAEFEFVAPLREPRAGEVLGGVVPFTESEAASFSRLAAERRAREPPTKWIEFRDIRDISRLEEEAAFAVQRARRMGLEATGLARSFFEQGEVRFPIRRAGRAPRLAAPGLPLEGIIFRRGLPGPPSELLLRPTMERGPIPSERFPGLVETVRARLAAAQELRRLTPEVRGRVEVLSRERAAESGKQMGIYRQMVREIREGLREAGLQLPKQAKEPRPPTYQEIVAEGRKSAAARADAAITRATGLTGAALQKFKAQIKTGEMSRVKAVIRAAEEQQKRAKAEARMKRRKAFEVGAAFGQIRTDVIFPEGAVVAAARERRRAARAIVTTAPRVTVERREVAAYELFREREMGRLALLARLKLRAEAERAEARARGGVEVRIGRGQVAILEKPKVKEAVKEKERRKRVAVTPDYPGFIPLEEEAVTRYPEGGRFPIGLIFQAPRPAEEVSRVPGVITVPGLGQFGLPGVDVGRVPGVKERPALATVPFQFFGQARIPAEAQKPAQVQKPAKALAPVPIRVTTQPQEFQVKPKQAQILRFDIPPPKIRRPTPEKEKKPPEKKPEKKAPAFRLRREFAEALIPRADWLRISMVEARAGPEAAFGTRLAGVSAPPTREVLQFYKREREKGFLLSVPTFEEFTGTVPRPRRAGKKRTG